MEGRPRPAEGPTRDRLTLQLAISVRGQLQICNSAPLHAGPILPRSTRLAELYLARRGRLCTATGRDRSIDGLLTITRKINRLARATKSGIAHAVKSFNMCSVLRLS